MKSKKNRSIFILAAVILISLAVFNSINNLPINKQVIYSRFVAGEKMGFDLDPGKLNFGQIVPGYSASREITITNNYNEPTITTIKSSGDISDYVIVSENNFALHPAESKTLTFSAFPPKELSFGEYSGEIIIITKKYN